MQALQLHMYARLTSDQGLVSEMQQLTQQMQGLQPGSPEYEYDQLALQREQLELKIREQNPNLDPMTLSGERALQKIMATDAEYQGIIGKMNDLLHAYPSQSTSWGIPMASGSDVECVEIS